MPNSRFPSGNLEFGCTLARGCLCDQPCITPWAGMSLGCLGQTQHTQVIAFSSPKEQCVPSGPHGWREHKEVCTWVPAGSAWGFSPRDPPVCPCYIAMINGICEHTLLSRVGLQI